MFAGKLRLRLDAMSTEVVKERPTVHMLTCEDMSKPRSVATRAGVVVIYSSKCPGKEGQNEDAVAVIDCGENRSVLLVADGVGGHADGQVAARIAVENIVRALQAPSPEDAGLRPSLLNGIENANRAVGELGTGAATTLAAVTLEDRELRTYHVGDSAVLLSGQRGKIKEFTIAHSPIGYAVESGLLDADAAMHHEDRHLVSNVIGSAEMRIEIGPKRQLARFDTLLVASDGVFDNLHLDEIVELIRKGPLMRAAEQLSCEIHARMTSPAAAIPCKPDDASFVLLRQ